MSICFFYLSRYPFVYQCLAEEIRSSFTSGDDIKSGLNLTGCNYLRAFIDECLRITPPSGTTLWRDVPKDSDPVIVDGHIISPGTCIGVNVYSLHHNEVYFREPFRFLPERWLPEESGLSTEDFKRMRDAFSPFLLGRGLVRARRWRISR